MGEKLFSIFNFSFFLKKYAVNVACLRLASCYNIVTGEADRIVVFLFFPFLPE